MLVKIFCTSIFIIIVICPLKAQTSLSISEFSAIRSREEIPLNISQSIRDIVDIDNIFDFYEGTWTAQVENEIVTFIITKSTRNYVRGITLEVLKINYKIENLNGDLIFDSTLMLGESYSGMEGEYFNKNGYYTGRWGHRDTTDDRCSSSGFFFLKRSDLLIAQPVLTEQIEFSYIVGRDMSRPSCTNGYETPPIPYDQILTFTKM